MRYMKLLAGVILALCMILTFASCGASEEGGGGYMRITAEDAKKIMDSGNEYVILDVRTQEEYDEKHIPDSVLIPDYEIEEQAEKVLTDKDQTILVYCRSGNRSRTASEKLIGMGYTDVKDFCGINDWPYETE